MKISTVIKWSFILTAVIGLAAVGLCQTTGLKRQVSVDYDFSKNRTAAFTSGPVFGMSWLMQNKFINTFDFAIGRNKSILQNDRKTYNNQFVVMRYEIEYSPLSNARFRPSLGFGVEGRMNEGHQYGLESSILSKVQYSFTNKYFIEVTVPYYFFEYYSGLGVSNILENKTLYKVYSGYDFNAKRMTAFRIGLGMNL